jgi:transposase
MNYCGIDVSKKSSHYCIMNAERSVVARGKVGNHRVDLKREFGPMAPMKIVLEACGIGFWMADQLEELGHAVTVVDPGKTKAIGSSRIKNDKLDARVLATLCQADLVAPVDRPSQAERYARMPAVTRDALVKARTALINTVRGMLHSEGVLAPSCGTAAFTETIRALPEGLDVPLADAIAPLLASIDALNAKAHALEVSITKTVKADRIGKLLLTAPGVGPLVASQFMCAVRDPRRFKTGRHLAAYLGLVPTLRSSGDMHVLGRITKRGSRRTRWLMTMAANALLRSKRRTALRDWGERKVEQLGRKKAVVAIARKLALALWSMWMHERAFEPRLPAPN